MKNNSKLSVLVFLAALLVLTAAACKRDEPVVSYESRFLGSAVKIDEQVWRRNEYASKISQAHIKYSGTHDYVLIETIVPKSVPPYYDYALLGTGSITGGILNFTIPESVMAGNLANFNYDLSLCTNPLCDANCYNCFDEHGCNNHLKYVLKLQLPEWLDLEVSPADTKGNLLVFMAMPDAKNLSGMIDREGLFGNSTSAGMDYVWYFYVDRTCTVTGKKSSGYIPGQHYFYSENDLHLTLEKGFNLVSRKETYKNSGSGSAYISVQNAGSLKNPEKYKWVIQLGYVFPEI